MLQTNSSNFPILSIFFEFGKMFCFLSYDFYWTTNKIVNGFNIKSYGGHQEIFEKNSWNFLVSWFTRLQETAKVHQQKATEVSFLDNKISSFISIFSGLFTLIFEFWKKNMVLKKFCYRFSCNLKQGYLLEAQHLMKVCGKLLIVV